MNYTYGYARVSAEDQNLATQLDALNKAGCDKIVQEKITGMATSRPALDQLLGYLRPGDTLIVARFFRLGRNSRHLIELIEHFNAQNIHFRALDFGVDSTTPAGKMMLEIFAALSEFQRKELLEKTKHGRELAKANGTHMGRRKGAVQEKLNKVATLLKRGVTDNHELVQLAGVSLASVKRYRKQLEEAAKLNGTTGVAPVSPEATQSKETQRR